MPTTDDWDHQTVYRACIVLAAIAFAAALVRNYPHTVSYDAAFFQHAGWYMHAHDAVIYRDIWDIKPPLLHETSLVIAIVAFGDPYWIHALSTLFSGGMMILSVVCIGLIVYHYTREIRGSILAGAVALSFAGYHNLSGMGIRPKYPAIALGLLGILLVLKDHVVLGGLVAAAAPAYIQHAAIYPVIALGLAYQYHGRDGVIRVVWGVVAAVIMVLAPIVYWGASEAMLTEVVLVSFVENGSRSLMDLMRLSGKGLHYMGLALPALAIGAYGAFRYGVTGWRRYWWLALGALFATIQIYFLDFDSYPDLFFGLTFAAIGFGILYYHSHISRRRVLAFLAVTGYLVSVVSMGGFGVITSDDVYQTGMEAAIESDTILHAVIRWVRIEYGPTSMRADDPAVLRDHGGPEYDVPHMKTLFWEQRRPPSCHYRMSGTEQRWMQTMERGQDDPCGEWPSGYP